MTIFDVTGYGAVGDGVADDTPAIQAAAAVAHATNNAVLYFPAGTYRTTAELSINPRRVSMRGDGPQVTSIAPDLSAGQYALALGWDGSTEVGIKSEPYDAVRGLSFIGPTGAGQANCLRLSTATNIQANSLTFRDVGFYGFDVQVDLTHNTYLIRFDRCFFSYPQTHGVRMDDVTHAGENISFDSCVFAGGPGTMVYVNKSGAFFYFTQCSFDYCARALWQRAGSVSMCHCHFETGTTYGGTGTEFLLVDRRGYASRPMLSLTDCDFYTFPDNYDTIIRLRGDNGDQALRITNPNIGVSSAMCPYLVRDDGPYTSNIRIVGAWYSRGDIAPPKLRAQNGSEWPVDAGPVYTQQGPVTG